MTLTLGGSSRLAGTYVGYDAFGRYLEVLRRVLRSAGQPITFVHEKNEMAFKQVMIVYGPKHDAEMALVVTVLYDDEGKDHIVPRPAGGSGPVRLRGRHVAARRGIHLAWLRVCRESVRIPPDCEIVVAMASHD